MKLWVFLLSLFLSQHLFSLPQFKKISPLFQGHYEIDGSALCETAKHTLAYLNKGFDYDAQVIHEGKIIRIPLERVKATLAFICKNKAQMNNPHFIEEHFDFVRWYPDLTQAKQLAAHKPLLKNLPPDRILMTKYYVHLAAASTKSTPNTPYPLYALPDDEHNLNLEQANKKHNLIRFRYGKQAILRGALEHQAVTKLAYLSRDDLESALLQGTVIANFGDHSGKKVFNVHRNNNIAYDKNKNPYAQERFWYFKEVDGIKGYGKDADYKITVNPKVTFAADLLQFGLGKMLLIQYHDSSKRLITKAGILADTGGAFANNLYQVDYLSGSYPGTHAFSEATRQLPDYVDAYFMVLKQ